MSAEVTKETGPSPFVAWCKACQDGVRYATVKRAQAWADKHNAGRHPAA